MASRSSRASARLALDGLYRGVEVLWCPDCGVFHFTHQLLVGEQSFRRADDAFDAIDVLVDRGVLAYLAGYPPKGSRRRAPRYDA